MTERLNFHFSQSRVGLSHAAAVVAGLLISSAYPLGIAASVAAPTLAMCQDTRRSSYTVAATYYAGALWPLIPGAKNFFSTHTSLELAVLLWLSAVVLLAAPWALFWSGDRRLVPWRAALALLASAIPPLGIIGWASPLTAAGILFPGLGAVGLILCLALPGCTVRWPVHSILFFGFAVAATHVFAIQHPPHQLDGWQAINTRYGDVSTSPLKEFQVAETIQDIALKSSAKVIVLPETVVTTWTGATDLFWQATTEELKKRGSTIVVGARIPLPTPVKHANSDYAAALQLLNTGTLPKTAARSSKAHYAYDNAVIVRGAANTEARQMIPVPIGMWNPFTDATAHMHLAQERTVKINNEIAAVLICYEQRISWPIIAAMINRPSAIIAVANDHWASGTTIPAFQRAAVGSWAALLNIPYVFAQNN